MNISSSQLRNRILALYPEIERYSLGLTTEFSVEKDAWIITLNKDGETLFTHIDSTDAERCLEGRECMHLGNQMMNFMDAYCTGSHVCTV
ncbi:hypothetical protein [Maridesulfovibrio sp. FT414]|uniref:hypothetical protein n=1 Tax=Maridesulfovibrio sp. FT414 TaxID=2979469 RepID=UPI003D802301